MTALAIKPNLAHRSRRHAERARLGNQGRAPVRARSPGDAEAPNHCRNLDREERRRLLRVIDEWNEASRVGGVAPLTPSALRLMRVMLFQCMDWTTGWLDPALTYLARLSGRAYQTVVSAKAQLEGLGVLKVQRRSRRGDDPGGPSWVQDTNLYRFELPEKIATWWRNREAERAARRKARAPADADVAAERAGEENAQAERAWWQLMTEVTREQAARDGLAAAGRARGPGAAALRREAEAAARARGVLPPPESNS